MASRTFGPRSRASASRAASCSSPSVPAAFSRWPQDQILHDILSEVPDGKPALRDLIESIAATCACKATIRTGDGLTEEEMRGLLDQLFATDLPYSCPHGRPTVVQISTETLARQFGRGSAS